MDDTTSLLLQRIAVLQSQLKDEKMPPNLESIETLIGDLEQAIEGSRRANTALLNDKEGLSRQNLELVRRNDLLLRQKEGLERQAQNLERNSKTLERHNTNLLRQNSQLERHNAALEEHRVALDADRRRYRELFEYAPDAALITDTSGLIQNVNQAAAVLLNVTPQALHGENLITYVSPSHQKLFVTLLTHLQRIQDVELCIQPHEKPALDISLTLSALYNEKGKPALLHWVLHDISERRRAMAALNASERRFRTIFNEASIGILLLDLEGKIVRANRSFQEMLGYSEEELYNRLIRDLTCPEDAPLGNVGLMLQENRQGQFFLEIRLRRRDGQYLWTSISLSGIHGEQGQLLNLIGMVKDITTEKQAAAELAEMRRRLLESGEVERLRLAQELHDGPTQDLYSTVFAVSHLTELTSDPALQTHLKELQELLKKVANTLRDIVGELRPPTIANLGLERAIRSHADKVQEQYPGLDLKLHLSRDGQSLNPQTRLAFFRIYQQGLSNILRHAQATQAVVAFHSNETVVSMDIWDNGKGFNLPKKWVDLLREGHYGLAGIAERVHALGGTFTVETRPGSGTLIHVTAPISKDELPANPSDLHRSGQPASGA